jgi:signal transduction histidine kinase
VSLIRTTAEVAVQKTDRTAQEYFEALQEILAESERTSQVVDSLMLLARADSGTETLESADEDACSIVREAGDQGAKLARSHGLAFVLRIPDAPVPVAADSNALRRALLILIDNAVKYTPRGGGTVKVDLETIKDFAVVSVSDTGIGIAKADIPHIFDRFWRADKTRSREEGGVGLGLSIAKWIVEIHRGSIHVESELGKGSTFHVRVPLHNEHGGAK